jgi:hypothetical protein
MRAKNHRLKSQRPRRDGQTQVTRREEERGVRPFSRPVNHTLITVTLRFNDIFLLFVPHIGCSNIPPQLLLLLT